MKKTIKAIGIILLVLFFIISAFGLYLNRSLPVEILPAQFDCLDLSKGEFKDFDTIPNYIFGVGLAYAGHINETASDFDPGGDPPIFLKSISSITYNDSDVIIPDHESLSQAIDQLEPGLKSKLDKEHKPLPALLDYEVEMGFVLLEDISDHQLSQLGFAPRLGYFMSNDLSARSLAILGEGQSNRYDYWGVSKSFAGFTPVTQQVWVPNQYATNSIPCINISTEVNGELRQNQATSDLIYTPVFMLQAIKRKYPKVELKKGDWVLTGTPGGVAMSAPRWLVRLAGMIGMDRFDKLGHSTGPEDQAKFLKGGDLVTVKGEGLGEVSIKITD